MREQHLADPGRVQRQPRADPADHRHRRDPGEPVDVEHLVAVALREVDGRSGGGLQVLEVRRRDLAHLGLHGREQACVPHAPPDDVRPVVQRLQCPSRDEAADDPQRGRWGQSAALGEVDQAQASVVVVEGPEHVHGAVHQGGAGGGAAGHVASIFH